MDDPIETDRLIARPFTSCDVDAAFGWFGDPEVMRFTPSGPDRNLAETAARIAGYEDHQVERGFSKWIIVDRASGQPIGDSGLLVLPNYGWIDFGFRLSRRFWGKGFATEVATAWVSTAFGQKLKLDQLTAIVHPENIASRRVLKKLRFVEDRRDSILGMESIVCFLTPERAEASILDT